MLSLFTIMLNIKIHVLIQLLHVIVKFEAFVIGFYCQLNLFIEVFITNNIDLFYYNIFAISYGF